MLTGDVYPEYPGGGRDVSSFDGEESPAAGPGRRRRRPVEEFAVSGSVVVRFREIRRYRGWSAAELADRMQALGVGWNRHIVANLESGRRWAVTVDELMALSAVLEVEPAFLLGLGGDVWADLREVRRDLERVCVTLERVADRLGEDA